MSLTLTRRHNVDRFGYLIPHHYGNLPMVGAVATYRPGEGRFGGAVAVEEGTVNGCHPLGGPYLGLVATSCTIQESELVSPNGLHDAVKVSPVAGANVGGEMGARVSRRGDTVLSNNFSASVFLRAGEFDRARVRFSMTSAVPTGGAGVFAEVDLRSGAILKTGFSGSVSKDIDENSYLWRIESLPNGWFRVIVENVLFTGPGAGNPADENGYLTTTYITVFPYDSEQLNGDGESGIHVWGPQIEAKPFATSFVDGTRPDGILAYPIALPENHTIACYRKSHTDEDYKHVVKRSDGKVFVDGVEDSEYDVGWIAGRNLIIRSTETANSYINLQGEVVTQSNHSTSDYIPVNPGNNYMFTKKDSNLTSDAGYYRWAWYDEDKNYISRRADSRNEFLWTAPSGAYYVRISYPKDSSPKFEKGSTATDWTPAPEDLGYSDDCLMFSNQTGLIDELLILPYAASEEEIVSWYEAQGPLPPHPQALLQWDRQAVRPAQIVKL